MNRSKLTVVAGIAGLVAASGLGLGPSGAAVPPTTEVDLAFGESNVLTEVLVTIGEQVEEGEALARIESGKQEEDLRVAEANLAAARARLADLLAGRTPAEAEQDAVAVDRAAAALEAAERDRDAAAVSASVSGAQRAADMRQAEAALQDAQETASANRRTRQLAVDQAAGDLAAASTASTLATQRLAAANTALAAARVDLAAAEEAYEQAGCVGDPSGPSCADLAAEVDRLEAEVDAATGTVAQAEDAVRQATDGHRRAQDAYHRARNEQDGGALADSQVVDRARDALTNAQLAAQAGALNDAEREAHAGDAVTNAELDRRSADAAAAIAAAGPTADAIADAEAAVAQAEAAVAAARRALERTTLRAPADGVVIAINGDVGEMPGSGGGGEDGGGGAFLTLEVQVQSGHP